MVMVPVVLAIVLSGGYVSGAFANQNLDCETYSDNTYTLPTNIEEYINTHYGDEAYG